MKKLILIHMLLGIVLYVASCGQTENTNEQLDILNPTNREESVNEERRAKLGYVRYTKEELAVNEDNSEFTMDREQMANIITRTIIKSGNFNEVASLVTDREIVIAYDKHDDLNENEATEIAKKTARSLLPSFYKIYTTDEPAHMDVIHSLHLEQTNNQSDLQVIEQIIQGLEDDNDERDGR
ncbi:YhcN/YlaJ family sporulation lipoprotein [Oceanobacillus alkalisoli]|uniref:YhcN/YlaJ family sporulation lipoprotein n=1 Tax=Oceanobacillus alkalisoli TaxID=2925113 RepID=UPI001EF09C05|nr:YhcN/YlaJ family sporulation lipoprotein [Oceanobacillus alkalisoli]MCF3943256.1 YhcN/YlaJ family sporulation lipoprotein [Oceanobacillus alkalisoli]MCG5103867.1 YhcN/YlaJ family sporulation lipoprotein [Oceanobacillus alkalisoli]